MLDSPPMNLSFDTGRTPIVNRGEGKCGEAVRGIECIGATYGCTHPEHRENGCGRLGVHYSSIVNGLSGNFTHLYHVQRHQPWKIICR